MIGERIFLEKTGKGLWHFPLPIVPLSLYYIYTTFHKQETGIFILTSSRVKEWAGVGVDLRRPP